MSRDRWLTLAFPPADGSDLAAPEISTFHNPGSLSSAVRAEQSSGGDVVARAAIKSGHRSLPDRHDPICSDQIPIV